MIGRFRLMPRFVILFHQTPPGYERPSHWDLMLEAGAVLRTWALTEEPRTGSELVAEPLADHRVAYLDYEGPVSGGRGEVSRWDHGNYSLDGESDERLDFRLDGRRLKCRATLSPAPESGGRWRLRLSEL
jgi:hypothetical protein